MDESLGEREMSPIKCWGCEGKNMYKDLTKNGDRMRTMDNIQEDTTFDDVARDLPKIYATLENPKVDRQSNIVKVEGKIDK